MAKSDTTPSQAPAAQASVPENTTNAPQIPGAPTSAAVGARVRDQDAEVKAVETQTSGKGWEYQRVVFHPRSRKSDTEGVKLKLNGVGLLFHREKEVICPVPYLRACDECMEEQFNNTPEEGFKRRAPVKRYNYTVIGNATEAQYLEALKTGNANAKKYRMTMQPVQ